MQLDMDAAQALAEPLRPIFDEAGMQLEISTPDRWHLRLPPDTPLPDFAAPEQALGEDLAQHLRSEEHTSELQSLMRISYAVFCLKKKKQNNIIRITNMIQSSHTKISSLKIA